MDIEVVEFSFLRGRLRTCNVDFGDWNTKPRFHSFEVGFGPTALEAVLAWAKRVFIPSR